MAREHAAMARSPDCFPQVSQSSAAAAIGKRATAASAAGPSNANFERRIFIPVDVQAVEAAYPRTQAPQGDAPPAHISSGSGVRQRTKLSTRRETQLIDSELPIHPAKPLYLRKHARVQGGQRMLTGAVKQKANTGQLYRTRLLRPSSERPGRRAAEKCNELAPPHAPPDLRGCQSIRWRTRALK